jgi:acetoin utilization protein AcuC
MSSSLFIGSEIYRASSYGLAHPLRIPRVSTVMDLCRAMGWFAPGQYRISPQARAAALTAFHNADYVAALQEAERLTRAGQALPEDWAGRFGLGTLSNPALPEMFRRPATGAGGVMLAAELVAKGGAVHVPGGGTHHGLAGRANGFCYLNDVVLGILHLRRLGVERVAYVDLDAHHSDGVEAAFLGDPAVLMISVHEAGRWPFTGQVSQGNVVNLAVPAGYNDSEAEVVLERLIRPRVAAFRPGAIVLQCGADSLAEDPLSRLCLSNNAYRRALAALRPLASRLIVLGGGGYHPWAVGRLWALLWADLAGHAVPEVLPEAAQAVLAGLSWKGGGRAAPDRAMITTLVDPPRPGPVRAEVLDRLAELD